MNVEFPTPNVLAIRGILFDEIASLAPILKYGGPTLLNSSTIIDLWGKATADKTSTEKKVRELALTLTAGMNSDFRHVELLDQDAQEEYDMSFRAFIARLQTSPTELDDDSFLRALEHARFGRSIFHVTGDQIGLGPSDMAQGDIVVVFHGGIMPFVLRPLASGDYSLVGEC